MSMQDDSSTFYRALRTLRADCPLSSREIAEQLGFDTDHLDYFETGRTHTEPHVLWNYLNLIGKTFVDLHLAIHPEPASPRVQALIRELKDLPLA